MKFSTALIAMAGIIAAPAAFGQPAAGVDPSQAQQIVTKACAACHAADGNSVTPVNPGLAGQHAEYITKQLMNFKSGERKNAVMSGMVAALSPEDMRNLGAYFGGQKPKPRAARDVELVKSGQAIYRGGVTAKGVPACAGCHLANGAGIPSQYPRLAGQHADYTLAQLQAFRLGGRANDPNKMMRAIASRMGEQEMKAVAEYIAGLR